MSFIATKEVSRVGPEGPLDAKIAFIGEAPAAEEFRLGRPFMGPAGGIFDQCLRQAGILRPRIYITNFVKERIPYGGIVKYWNPRTHRLTQSGERCASELYEELAGVKANILVPMGGPASSAVAGVAPITDRRGYLTNAVDALGGRKCLPTLHPASALYGGSYINSFYIAHDFQKAARLSATPAIEYPVRQLVICESYEEALSWLETMSSWNPLSFDIEVSNYEISSIAFSQQPSMAVAVPFDRRWSLEQETELWRHVARLLENPATAKCGHNLIFDTFMLADRNGIFVQGELIDTMVAHSIIYPDFRKRLAFIASIYTDQWYWKDMIDFDDLKEGNNE